MIPNYRIWIKTDKKHYRVFELHWLDVICKRVHCYYDKDNGAFGSIRFILGDNSECTLESSTGEHDRNKREIFEGDIYEWEGYEVQNGKQIRPVRRATVTDDIESWYRLKNLVHGNGTVSVIGHIHEEKP